MRKYDGRYDEYYVGMVTGLGYMVIWLGIMVAAKDLATDVSSLVLGGFLIVMGILLCIGSIASIIARVRKRIREGFPSDTIYEFPSDRERP